MPERKEPSEYMPEGKARSYDSESKSRSDTEPKSRPYEPDAKPVPYEPESKRMRFENAPYEKAIHEKPILLPPPPGNYARPPYDYREPNLERRYEDTSRPRYEPPPPHRQRYDAREDVPLAKFEESFESKQTGESRSYDEKSEEWPSGE
jgi:hypothetical protein